MLELLREFATSYEPDPSAFIRHFPLLVRSGSAALLVAEHQRRVVGYVLAFDLLTLFANGIVVEIQELVVEPAYRSHGIGRLLVTTILERARRSRAREVTVPTRRAADFYRELGFEETATYLKLEL